MLCSGISLKYHTLLKIFRHGFMKAIEYLGEVLDRTVRLYAAAYNPASILMDDIVCLRISVFVEGYLESARVASIEPDLNTIENLWYSYDCTACTCFPPRSYSRIFANCSI